jgi:putative spermidine/putrescine transport system ATP-binding protein
MTARSSSTARTSCPLSPQKRGIGMVFQSYALFPNMTVEQNVAFGLRMQKVNANDSHKRTAEALQLVELNDYAKRYPHQLSGVANASAWPWRARW